MVWTEPKYPEDVPKLTPEDKYRDPVALLEYREAVARRKQIDVEKARLLREEVRRCYLREGVNHFQSCRQIVGLYLEHIQGVGSYRSNSGRYDVNRPGADAEL